MLTLRVTNTEAEGAKGKSRKKKINKGGELKCKIEGASSS